MNQLDGERKRILLRSDGHLHDLGAYGAETVMALG